MSYRIFLLLLLSASLQAQKMQTLTYFKNDTLSLQLDLFTPEKPTNARLPLLLFVHGGGFSGGDRTSGHVLCRHLAKNGYAAATISYPLYVKNKKFSCDGSLVEKVRAFRHGTAALWAATGFFIDKAASYNIDPSQIFIAGCSAGAETVLHAAYWDKSKMDYYHTPLPDGFRYAGLISGAGAIMDLNLINKQNLIPMLFFHGNGDKTVPYGTAPHHYCEPGTPGWLMLFGSYPIHQKAIELDGTSALYTYCGGGHEYSGILFEKDVDILREFLDSVRAKKKTQTHVIMPTGKKNEVSAAYSFCD